MAKSVRKLKSTFIFVKQNYKNSMRNKDNHVLGTSKLVIIDIVPLSAINFQNLPLSPPLLSIINDTLIYKLI